MDHVIKYLPGTEHMLISIHGCDMSVCMPESDFCFMKFMLARTVVFVDTNRPSGACCSKFDGSVYT